MSKSTYVAIEKFAFGSVLTAVFVIVGGVLLGLAI